MSFSCDARGIGAEEGIGGWGASTFGASSGMKEAGAVFSGTIVGSRTTVGSCKEISCVIRFGTRVETNGKACGEDISDEELEKGSEDR